MQARAVKLPPPLAGLRSRARQSYAARSVRERMSLLLVLYVVLAFVLWVAAVQPAWRTLRAAPAELDRLDMQLQQMQRTAEESRSLRSASPVSLAQANAALKSATAELGASGRLSMQGDRAVLTLTDASPEAIVAWLEEARSAARARPVEAQLMHASKGYTGTVIVTLGAAP